MPALSRSSELRLCVCLCSMSLCALPFQRVLASDYPSRSEQYQKAADQSHNNEVRELEALADDYNKLLPGGLIASTQLPSHHGYWFPGDPPPIYALRMCYFRWLSDVLTGQHTASQELIDYLSERTLDPAFEDDILTILAKDPRSASRATQIRAIVNGQVDTRGGLRGAVRAQFADLLGALGQLDVDMNPTWREILALLMNDLSEQLDSASKAFTKDQNLGYAMNDSYWHAVGAPDRVAEAYKRISQLEHKSDSHAPALYYVCLGKSATAITCLNSPQLQEYLDDTILADEELISAFRLKEVKGSDGVAFASGLNGLFPFYGAFWRQKDYFLSGRRLVALDALISLGDRYLYADERIEAHVGITRFYHNCLGYRTGCDHPTQLERQKVKATVDAFEQYDQNLRNNGSKDEPLYAAVDIDASGNQRWSLGGWLMWSWLKAADVRALDSQKRIIPFAGRRWVLPAETKKKDIRSFEDIYLVGAQELILGLDLTKLPSAAYPHLVEH